MRFPAGKAIRADGIVQGVGFRPWVRNTASRLGLTGDVCNTSGGVVIHAYGPADSLKRLLEVLRREPPPLADIRSLDVADIPYVERADFDILESQSGPERTVAVTPDAGICADCRGELLDPSDRRYRYPFINCTNCGPRYTIIRDVPYDRPNTTMAAFTMCAACRAEYEDPADRRYHAQPNCCADCGPRLALKDGSGRSVPGDPLSEAVLALHGGDIVAVKGLGGFHLACDAANEDAVRRLRKRKDREEKPLAVMVADADAAARLVYLPDYGRRLLESPQAPILLARKRHPSPLAPSVSPVNDYYGVMVAYAPLHVLLLADGPDCLVMTSANRTDEPICIDNDEAADRLGGIADLLLVHDRPIHIRADDSVVAATPGRPTIIRRARGYVPQGVETGLDVDGIVGFGAMLKNTPAVGRGSEVYPGQHIGDLNNRLAMDMLGSVYAHLREILGVEIRHAACDLHPDYPTTPLAESSGLPVTRVQHHHAHLAGLMAEVRHYERSIGIALDGTGLGDDGAIWGGEVFAFDARGYERMLHLEYVPLPGGDAAAREPWRMALAYLVHHGFDWEGHVQHPNARNVAALVASPLCRWRTSSMGRLFDAVSALCGLCEHQTFEAKAPMLLEGAIEETDGTYEFAIGESKDGGAATVSTRGIVAGILDDLAARAPVGVIAGRFHATVVRMLVRAAQYVRSRSDLETVFLSGGCMVNGYLAHRAPEALRRAGFRVHTHALLPPNDGGISAGQVVVAAARRAEP